MKLLHDLFYYLNTLLKPNKKHQVVQVRRTNKQSEKNKEVEVDESILLILWVCRCFGTTPMVFEKITCSKWNAKQSPLLELYGWLLIPVFSIPCGFCTYRFVTSDWLISGFKVSVKASDMTLIYVAVIYLLVTIRSRTKSLLLFIRVINKIEQDLGFEQRQLRKKDRHRMWYCLLSLTLSAALVIAEQYLEFMMNRILNVIWVVYGPYSLPQYFLLVFYAQFIYLVRMLNVRVEIFLQQLKIMKKHTECPLRISLLESYQTRSGRRMLVQEIQNAAQLQQYLRAAVCHLNAAFSTPMLLIMLSNLLHLSNLALILIQESCAAKFPINLASQFVWFLFHWCWLTAILEPCNKVQTQGKEISNNLMDILSFRMEMDSRYGQSHGFLLHGLWRWQRIFDTTPSKITGFDVFSLDRNLLGTIAGAVATFTVVMMQIPDL